MAGCRDCRRRPARAARSQTAARGLGSCNQRSACSGLQRERQRVGSQPRATSPRLPATMTIDEFGRRLRASEITAEQVTEECLQRIDSDNPRLNAFILVMREGARRQACEADRELAAGRDRGPLHGVPISIKDLIDIRGTVTTAASAVRTSAPAAAEDAPAVAHLRDAGAVFVGKTNLHEFALGTTSEDTVFGAVKNPLDLT